MTAKAPAHTLHDKAVRWLAEIAGDFQREVSRLKKENIHLRKRVQQLEAEAKPKAMAAGVGKL